MYTNTLFIHIIIQLKYYTISGNRTPIELTGLGYASFCKRNPQLNTGDFIVVEYQEEYSTNFVSTGVTMVFLAVVSFLGAPLLVYFLYNYLHKHVKRNLYYQFLTWAVILVFVIADYAFTSYMLYHIFGWARTEWNTSFRPHYWGAIVLCSFAGGTDSVLAAIIVYKSAKDFPVPKLISATVLPLFYFLKCFTRDRDTITQWVKNITRWAAVSHTIISIQFFSVYTMILLVTFFARPIHTATLLISYGAFTFFLIATLALLLAATNCDKHTKLFKSTNNTKHTESSKRDIFIRALLTVTFIMALLFVCSFAFLFLRFAKLTESTEVLGIVGSLSPTLVVSAFGYLATRLLRHYSAAAGNDNTADESKYSIYERMIDTDSAMGTTTNTTDDGITCIRNTRV